MSALAVSQLLEDAQSKGYMLALETKNIENEILLEAVEKVSLESLPRSSRRGLDQLVSFKDEAKAQKEEIERLESSNNNLQQELILLQEKIKDLLI